jgi:hypothetical protein
VKLSTRSLDMVLVERASGYGVACDAYRSVGEIGYAHRRMLERYPKARTKETMASTANTFRSRGAKCAKRCLDILLGCGRGAGVSTAATRLLDGRAFHRAVRTEDAAIACFRPKQHVTTGAFVEIEACVSRHGFGRYEATVRTSERGLEDWRGMHCSAPSGTS